MGIMTDQIACRGKLALFLVALVILWGYQPGFSDSQDIEQLRKAAEQGDAETQFSLGRIYFFGRGVPQDHKQAAKWYRQAAEQGHTKAQFMLGEMYARGSGVPWDYRETVKWYRRAAEAGDAGAHFKLGLMYEYGEGVPENEWEAEKWYREGVRRYRTAAEQGDVEAQYMLGSMYRTGKGVSQDHNEAMKWLRMSAEQGCSHGSVQSGSHVRQRLGRTPGPQRGGEVVANGRRAGFCRGSTPVRPALRQRPGHARRSRASLRLADTGHPPMWPDWPGSRPDQRHAKQADVR